MEPKKPRGRPRGSVIPTDKKALDAVADRLLQNPALRPTAAIKSVVADWTDSVVHRLMGKWRNEKDALLADAQRRSDAKSASNNSERSIAVGRSTVILVAQMRATQNNPPLLSAHELGKIPALKVYTEIKNSPTMRVFGEIQNSAAMARIKAIQDSPSIHIFKAIQESSAARMMCEIQKNPLIKMLRERERLWRI